MTYTYSNLKYDKEGYYSLSHKEDADKLSLILKNKYKKIKILDATAGVGGNSISFGQYFENVISIEIDKSRYDLLCENLSNYNLSNITINGNFMDNIDLDYNLIFIDPPWGGPTYKNEKKIILTLNEKSLKTITQELCDKNKIIVWKLPFNYDLNEFYEFNYEIYNIKNYLIIIINK
jgi:16S rRNA G966 N2-methylase RsmD